MKYLLFAILISVVVCKPKWTQLEGYNFDQYVKDFNKGYVKDSEEYNKRKLLFEKNLSEIMAFNKSDRSFKKGVNRNTDLTQEEFKGMKLGLQKSMKNPKNPMFRNLLAKSFQADPFIQLPDKVDWRQKGVVSPVKDQGICGSCWAFASAAVLESAAAIADGPGQLKTLSTQQLVSCVPNPRSCGGSGGCQGSIAELAFSYTTLYGITSEYKYSYGSYNGTSYSCKFNPKSQTPEVINQGYANVTPNDINALLQAVATIGPVVVSVDASNWGSYEGGIFDNCDYDKNIDINHAVVVVGYDSDPVYGDYWIVRNSWGTEYGENGYIRVKRESKIQCGLDTTPTNGFGCAGDEQPIKVCGMCGILSDSAYPLKVQVIG